MYFNVNFNVFFKLIKVHLLGNKLYKLVHSLPTKKQKGVENFLMAVVRCFLTYKNITLKVFENFFQYKLYVTSRHRSKWN